MGPISEQIWLFQSQMDSINLPFAPCCLKLVGQFPHSIDTAFVMV